MMNDGYISATALERPQGMHIAIDLFFRDLADVHKERAFCLVLSGMAQEASSANLQVFATDIDDRAITTAHSGLYPEAILTDVPPNRLRQNFTKENQQFRIRKDLRERVLFAQHSLLLDPPFSQIDLVVCRSSSSYCSWAVIRISGLSNSLCQIVSAWSFRSSYMAMTP